MDALPPNAVLNLPVLIREVSSFWPQVPIPATLPAQVEQETCVSLKSKGCWSNRTELKTSREYGFGFGQITITAKFDNFKEAKKLDASLASWRWDDRYNKAMQMRTLVLMDKRHYNSLQGTHSETERLAMAFSCYNGGCGGVAQDRKVCAAIKGCDPSKWFGNVELHSLKQKTAVKGYGKSFYEINREYVRNIMFKRSGKYVPYMR